MKAANRPITVTTTLSLALHASVIVSFVQTQHLVLATGQDLHIELVNSGYISNQGETERPVDKTVAASAMAQQPKQAVKRNEQRKIRHKKQTPKHSVTPTPAEPAEATAVPAPKKSIEQDADVDSRVRSTHAATHSLSIIDLLHSRISEHKQYPYIARRQRREGVARVEFVLHPDGSIDETRLIHSSKTRILDKAALDAVKDIAPFEAAKEFLHQPEAFQVDVVFNMI